MAQDYAIALNANITFGDGYVQYFNHVTIETGQDLLDVSAFGGTGYRYRIPGIKDLTGMARGFLAKGGTVATSPFGADSFSKGMITILFDVGYSVSFLGYIGKQTITTDYEGNQVISVQWAYADTAAPAITWSGS